MVYFTHVWCFSLLEHPSLIFLTRFYLTVKIQRVEVIIMNNFKYVNVAVCQSNIKSKKGSYFARVCKEGRINGRHLLYEIKKRTSGMDIDVAVIETVMEKMKDVIFDFVSSGYNVDFFNLGTFSLSTAGQLKVKESIAGYAPDEKDALLEINKKDENHRSCQ